MLQTGRQTMREKAIGALVTAILLAGCSAISPVGTNKATQPYPQPDEDGVVALTYSTDDEEVKKVAFRVAIAEDDLEGLGLVAADLDAVATTCEEAEDGKFCATLKTSKFEAGLYLVEIIPDGAEEAVATKVILVPTAPAEDAEGTGTKN